MSAHARTLSPAILSIQETKSWDASNLELSGYVCWDSKSGFATLLVSKQFCEIKRSWNLEERCTAILFGITLVMAVYAPECNWRKNWRCTTSVSRASLKYYEKDVGVESKTSALQVISMWNWDWCVQMKRTWTSKRKGQESWTWTWKRTRKNWVSRQYEWFHWIGFRWIVYAYWKNARGLRHSVGRWRCVIGMERLQKR